MTPENIALFTDLYELRMMEGYLETDHDPIATFDLFVRDLPPDRGYMLAAGLEQAIEYLQSLRFGERALEFLNELDFGESFLEYLASFEFSGEVRALPEGTLAFENEPLAEVTGPIAEVQLFETLLINQIGYQSLIATKAARMRDAVDRHGDDQSLVDFGSRRAHGVDAGMKAARAAYVGGFTGTSNVAAAEVFDIPVFGTMAHSWIQSFPTERDAFEAFLDVYGEDAVLLIDTYDTVQGAELAVDVAGETGIAGVRLDSGDLTALSKEVAEIIEDEDVFISSGVDEFFIEEFLREGGVGDGFGPGTALVTSTDAPKVETIYKLVAVEQEGELRPTMKLSTGKATYPGPKSVRRIERDGQYRRDVLDVRAGNGSDGKDVQHPGEEQLVTVLEEGKVVYDLPDLDEIRERSLRHLDELPEEHRALRDPTPYEVTIGESLQEMTGEVRSELERRR